MVCTVLHELFTGMMATMATPPQPPKVVGRAQLQRRVEKAGARAAAEQSAVAAAAAKSSGARFRAAAFSVLR